MTDADETRHNISESADKITLKAKLTRGEGTRDQDKISVKVKNNDPEEAVEKLNETVKRLNETAGEVRNIQPSEESDE